MEHIVTQEQMDALKALADTNMKISEAKNHLFKLKEEEFAYLQSREQKALEVIQENVEASQELIGRANKNFLDVVEIGRGVSGMSDSLASLSESFKDALADFEERNVLWQKMANEQRKEIETAKDKLLIQANQIENDKKTIESTTRLLKEDEMKIKDQWEEVSRAINRLKQGKS